MMDEWGRQKPRRSTSASSRVGGHHRGTSRALDWLTVLESHGTLPSTATLVLPSRTGGPTNENEEGAHKHREVRLRENLTLGAGPTAGMNSNYDRAGQLLDTSTLLRPSTNDEKAASLVTVNELQLEVNALKADVAERQWACARVLELGSALDVITEQNAVLAQENATLRRQVQEMELLRRAQHVLIASVDAGGIDSGRLVQLLASSESLQESCSELQEACRAVAKWGPSSCPSCLAAKEEKSRAELALKEVASRQSIQAACEAIFATQRYCTVQYTEVETERMWQEDMYSHYATLRQLQRDLNRAQREAALVPSLQEEVLYWKDKAVLQPQQHALVTAGLRDEYDQKLKEWKRSFLRSDGNTSLLRWLLVSGLKSFHAHGKLLFAASIQRKHLLLMKHEVHQFGAELRAQLRELETFCHESLRRMAPQDWTSVPVERPLAAPRRQQVAHPPVLSAYARNATVVQRSGSAKRSSSAPKSKPLHS